MVKTDDGQLICKTGGLECLADTLEEELSIYGTSCGDYNIAVDKESGLKYIIEDNGKVLDDDGNVICSEGGKACLAQKLLEGKLGNLTDINEYEGYQLITDKDGNTYQVTPDGKVVNESGSVVSEDGLDYFNPDDIADKQNATVLVYDDEVYLKYDNGTVVD